MDVGSLETEREQLRGQLRQLSGAKKKLTDMIDHLDVTVKHYDRKYQDMHDRLDNLMLRISSSNELTEDFELGIEKIKSDEELHFKNLNVLVHAGYLASLTERSMCQMTVGVYSEEKLLISETMNLTALAFDQ